MIKFAFLLMTLHCFVKSDKPEGGFQPIPHARGVPQGHSFGAGGGFGSEGGLGTYSAPSSVRIGGGGPTSFNQQTATNPKTIFVNVPSPPQPPPPRPIAAGPPRQHYRIIFIRSPSPPPAPQPILPPRTEQKTLIYVLHPKHQAQQQRIVEVPSVQHDPQVYFIQYDEPPTQQDLQQLVQGNIDGQIPAQSLDPNTFIASGVALPPAPAEVFAPGHNQGGFRGDSFGSGGLNSFSSQNIFQAQQVDVNQQSGFTTGSNSISNFDVRHNFKRQAAAGESPKTLAKILSKSESKEEKSPSAVRASKNSQR